MRWKRKKATLLGLLMLLRSLDEDEDNEQKPARDLDQVSTCSEAAKEIEEFAMTLPSLTRKGLAVFPTHFSWLCISLTLCNHQSGLYNQHTALLRSFPNL